MTFDPNLVIVDDENQATRVGPDCPSPDFFPSPLLILCLKGVWLHPNATYFDPLKPKRKEKMPEWTKMNEVLVVSSPGAGRTRLILTISNPNNFAAIVEPNVPQRIEVTLPFHPLRTLLSELSPPKFGLVGLASVPSS